jgi:DNA-binding transcriptional regulator YiaG
MGRPKMNIQNFYRQGEKLSKEPLHYVECGLDNIYLRNGFTKEMLDGEEYLSVEDIDGLHKAIGLHIVLEKKAPTGKELKFLRGELDMTQSDLARVLSVTDQSVARWEKGQSEPNGPAVLALRLIYLLSLVPDDKKPEVMKGIVERFNKLAQKDETTDKFVLSYCDDHWYVPALAA